MTVGGAFWFDFAPMSLAMSCGLPWIATVGYFIPVSIFYEPWDLTSREGVFPLEMARSSLPPDGR